MITAGIDLGNHQSSIATVNQEGIPTMLPDSHHAGAFAVPSFVHIDADGCLVGHEVAQLQAGEADLAILRRAKSSLGNRAPMFSDTAGQTWSSAAISALLLARLRHNATHHTLDELAETVIAVPAHFGDAQRRAMYRAAQLATLDNISLVEEPIAAATYLLNNTQRTQTVLVCDFASGTLSATVLRWSQGEIVTLAAEHNERVGGRQIDELLVKQMLSQWQRQFGDSVGPSSTDTNELLRIAECMKVQFCQSPTPQAHYRGLVGSRSFEFLLSKQHFVNLIEPQYAASLEVIDRCLDSAGLAMDAIDRVLLVGGGSLLPQFRQRVARHLDKSDDAVVLRQPQQAVAFGAALLAKQAEQRSDCLPVLRQSIANYDLGVRVRDPRSGHLAIYNLIKRNSSLPATGSKIFKTSRDDQTRLVIEVVQSRGNAAEALSLGHFSFGPLAEPRANTPIEVKMQYDREGLVDVRATTAAGELEVTHTLTHEVNDSANDFFDSEQQQVERASASFA